MYATTGTYNQGYPSKALAKLVSLQELWLDGPTNMSFDVEFRTLTKLHTVRISGDKVLPPWRSLEFCETNISSHTFLNLEQVTNLSVLNCGVKYIDNIAFLPLTKLKYLDFSGNIDLGIEGFFQSASNLSETLESLILENIENVRFMKCGLTLEKRFAEPLKRLKNLKHLSLAYNKIKDIQYEAFTSLENVKTIDVSRNEFDLGLYILYARDVRNLKKLDLSFNKFDHPLDMWRRMSKKRFLQSKYNDFVAGLDHHVLYPNTKAKIDKQFKAKPNSDYTNVCPVDEYFIPLCTITGFLPRCMEDIDISYSKMSRPVLEMCVDPQNELKTLTAAGSLIYCFDGPVHGLEKLENVDLSQNFARNISSVFFDGSPNLKRINLNGNLFHDSLRRAGPRLFYNTRSLEYLDLSLNRLENLPSNLFKYLDNLKVLNISDNTLTDFQFKLSHMKKLKTIDMSRNHISTLEKGIREAITTIATSQPNDGTRVQVNLTNNYVKCTCENRDFLQWVNSHFGSCVRLLVNISECYMQEGWSGKVVINSAHDLQNLLYKLERHCESYTWVIVTGSVVLVIFLMIVVGIVVHKFKWKITYWYYVTSRRITTRAGYSSIDDDAESTLKYRFHVYIASTTENTGFSLSLGDKLRARNYKVFHPQTDIIPGQNMYSFIANAIHISRVVLFVISEGCEEDNGWQIAMHMAHEESLQRDRKISLGVFIDRMPEFSWSLDILEMLRRCSLEFPSNGDEQEIAAFYHELADKIEGLDDTPIVHSLDIRPRDLHSINSDS